MFACLIVHISANGLSLLAKYCMVRRVGAVSRHHPAASALTNFFRDRVDSGTMITLSFRSLVESTTSADRLKPLSGPSSSL